MKKKRLQKSLIISIPIFSEVALYLYQSQAANAGA
jgi:hypothetical protein